MDAPPMDPEYLAADQRPTLRGVMWTMSMLPAFIVMLRVWVRVGIKKSFGWDDCIVIAALACLIGYLAVCEEAANLGLGTHIDVVARQEGGPQKLVTMALLTYCAQSLAIMACTLGKTSFAVTLLRIVVQPWAKWILWFIIVTMNIVNVLAAIFVFTQCKDPRNLWDKSIPSECWPVDVFTNFSLFVGSYSGLQDFVLALLPWKIVWGLQMSTKERVVIGFCMSMGVFAGIASIVKVTYLVALSKKADFPWELPPLLWWAFIEDGLAIIACSLPILRPLLRMFFDVTEHKSYGNSFPLHSNSNQRDMFPHPQGSSTAAIFQSKDEDQSDKTILGDSPNLAAIKQTREVDITYSFR